MLSQRIARSALFILTMIVLFATSLDGRAHHTPCDEAVRALSIGASEKDPDLNKIATTVAMLRRIHTDSTQADIPEPAIPMLTTLKHQLRDLIANRLRFQKRKVSTRLLRARTIVDLSELGLIDEQASGIDDDYIDNGYDYGDVIDITLTRPHPDFDVIAVTTTIGILCGDDSSLYLFRYMNDEWKLWLADEKNDYDRIDKAQGQFNFGLSWPDENNDYFVVTASVNPWCTSNWQRITYRVLRPGPDPYDPRVLLNRAQKIHLGAGDPPYRLNVDDSKFSLRFYTDRYEKFVIEGAELARDNDDLLETVQVVVKGNEVIEK